MQETLWGKLSVYTLVFYLCNWIQKENQWDTRFSLQLCNYVIKASFRWRKTNASRSEILWWYLAVKYLLDLLYNLCGNKHKVFGIYFALKSFFRDINEKIKFITLFLFSDVPWTCHMWQSTICALNVRKFF